AQHFLDEHRYQRRVRTQRGLYVTITGERERARPREARRRIAARADELHENSHRIVTAVIAVDLGARDAVDHPDRFGSRAGALDGRPEMPAEVVHELRDVRQALDQARAVSKP